MIINGQAEVTQRTGISSEVFSVGHLGPRLVSNYDYNKYLFPSGWNDPRPIFHSL